MAWTRRSFFGLVGGAAVSGPSAAKAVGSLSINDLPLKGISGGGSFNVAPELAYPPDESIINHHKGLLRRIIGLTPAKRALLKRRMTVYELDPDIAGLRSVSLRTKIEMTRDLQFERSMRNNRTFSDGIVSGLIDRDDDDII